ncbi:hypothetical protein DPEC_G00111410 [Dallia pectoralis]|uniref:Uncharacterized protein n=1 Tax=Dallia pectoralis TaxID=75939 RepID=A0ACC2GT50_DALPE|nr:hypothetical protein DPEC_G00111410 [Dallia pectoralis]
MDPHKTRQAMENCSCFVAELKELKFTTDDTQPHPNPAVAAATSCRMWRSENVSVAARCCEIMIVQSKARFEKTRHLVSFELTDPELFLLFETSFPQKQLDNAN